MEALVGWLEAAGVPGASVRVGGPGDAGCAEPADRVWRLAPLDPAEGGGWELYWSEGGERFEWTQFDDEATACFCLFGRLAWTRMVRGALAPVG